MFALREECLFFFVVNAEVGYHMYCYVASPINNNHYASDSLITVVPRAAREDHLIHLALNHCLVITLRRFLSCIHGKNEHQQQYCDVTANGFRWSLFEFHQSSAQRSLIRCRSHVTINVAHELSTHYRDHLFFLCVHVIKIPIQPNTSAGRLLNVSLGIFLFSMQGR